MSELNKAVLEKANAAVRVGDHEGFLSCCTDDVAWSTVGGDTLHGKDAVRAWMREAYAKPPQFTVNELIGEGDFVAALGEITTEDETGHPVLNAYCDVWRFRDGKMAELKAYVIALAGRGA